MKPKHIGFVVAVLAALGALLFLPVDAWVLSLVARIQALGPAGALLYGLLYVIATVAFLPGSPLTLGAGFAYGPLQGFLIVWPAATIGATIAFMLGRTLLRDRIQQQVAQRPRFAAIDRAIQEKGATMLFFLRLSPLFPFNLLNYAMGLTGLSLPRYVLATAIGIMPGTFLYVYLGSTLTQLSAILEGSQDAGAVGQALYWGGLIATLVATVLITRTARSALEDAVQQSADSVPADPRTRTAL